MTTRSLQFSAFTLDLDRMCLIGPAGKTELRPKSFEVLKYLVEHPGRVVSKEELVNAIWQNVTVTEESLTRCISDVRHAIGDGSQQIIRTVPRRGYLLDVPVSAGELKGVSDRLETDVALDAVRSSDNKSRHDTNKTIDYGAFSERKQVTVLNADLRGSLEHIAERDPEEALRIFEAALTLMAQAVLRYEGIVNVITDTGIVALFGVPRAHEDHAVRACYAALQIHEAVARHVEGLQHEAVSTIQVRVGLASGETVVRSIADGPQTRFRVMGKPANLAARLQQIATPGSSAISAETLRLAEGHVEVKPLVNLILSDNSCYQLVGSGPAQTRFQALAVRGLTRFIGRNAEMEQLERARIKAEGRQGQVVAIIGEPGLGKSRLLNEFIHGYETSRWLVLETAAVSYRQATNYQPVIDLLRSYFKIEARDDVEQVRSKVAGRLLELDQRLAPDLSAFLALLDIPFADPLWQGLDASQRRQHTLDALKHLIFCECHKQPTVVAVEDLHWIDSETQAFLEMLVDGLASARLLVIITYRPEYEHRWGSKSYYTQLRLDALSSTDTAEFLRNLIGGHESLGRLRELLPKQGNPLFLEESIRSLVEANILIGECGHYRLVRPLEGLQIPSTVHAILAARIDRLAAREKRLLQAASVVGKDVLYAILQPISELQEDELRRGLAELRDAELLYEARLLPDAEYSFKHALTHEVTYASLLAEERQMLHRRIMDVIERLYRDRLAEQIEIVAYHALKGEAWEKALSHCREAGAKAGARSAYAESVQYFEQALLALSHLPETRATQEQAIDIRLALRTALVALNEFDRGLAMLRETEVLALQLGDSRRLAQVSIRLSNHLYYMGETDQAVAAAERGVDIATGAGDGALLGTANLHLAVAQYGRGDYRQAIDVFATRATAFDRIGQTACSSIRANSHVASGTFADGLIGQTEVIARSLSAECHGELGMFADGFVLGEEALSIAERMAHPVSVLWALQGMGRLHLLQGNLVQAVPFLERALLTCREINIPHLYPRIAAPLGTAYCLNGRFKDAVSLLMEAVERARTRMMAHSASCYLSLGGAKLLNGYLQEAQELADVALAQSREHQQRGQEAYSLRLLGEVAARRTPPESALAESHYQEALDLAQTLGMRPLVAHCQRALSSLYRQLDHSGSALEHLTLAKEMYRDMEMRFWLDNFVTSSAASAGRT